jgi:alcohol dehydrogenase YqhD (iron-dependent ADH family)
MNCFDYYSPTRFIFGPDRENEVGSLCRDLAASKVLIHYGGGSVVRSGLLERVEASLSEAGIAHMALGGAVPNPRDELVYQALNSAAGKTSILSWASGAEARSTRPRRSRSGPAMTATSGFLQQPAKPERPLGLGTIVTLPASGTEGANSSVITRTADWLKRGLRSDLNRPDFSILNPDLTASLPTWQIACGAADILSHVFERYFTNTPGVLLTDNLCAAVIDTVIDTAPRLLADSPSRDDQANLIWSSTLAHIGLLGNGRQEDWSVHALEHELSALYDVAHGAALAALYPAWMQYTLPHNPARFARLAVRGLGVAPKHAPDLELAREGIFRLASFYRQLALPVNLRELGVDEADLPRLAAKVKRNPDGSCGFFLPLQDKDILAIYQLAMDWQPEMLTE